jgi:tRNA-splicing ligase RtcB
VELKQISPYQWELPKSGNMRVPGLVFAGQELAAGGQQNEALKQVANVAALPGIVKASMAMPDMHWGYGFPIGGVAAFDWGNGIISPGGVGYDINCGVRLAVTALLEKDIRSRLKDLVNALYQGIPSGVGSTGPLKLSLREEKKVLEQGSRWAIQQGFGHDDDLEHTEDHGCMPEADPDVISPRALDRGRKQFGYTGFRQSFCGGGCR